MFPKLGWRIFTQPNYDLIQELLIYGEDVTWFRDKFQLIANNMTGRITPERITELSMCEVFVFGSNLKGQHHDGAARMAYDRFGAEWGVGVGPTGKCYAIPTMHGGVEDIKPYVDDFVEYVKNHPNNRFLATRIGCGIAGFRDMKIAPLFKELKDTPNVCLPKNGF